MQCASPLRYAVDPGASARPVRSCRQPLRCSTQQSAVSVKQGSTSQTNRLGNRSAANAPTPSLNDLLAGFTACQRIQNLPHHDPSAFEGRFAMANFGVRYDVLAEFNAACQPLRRTSGPLHDVESKT